MHHRLMMMKISYKEPDLEEKNQPCYSNHTSYCRFLHLKNTLLISLARVIKFYYYTGRSNIRIYAISKQKFSGIDTVIFI